MKVFGTPGAVRYCAERIIKNRRKLNLFIVGAFFIILFGLSNPAFGDVSCVTETIGTTTSDWFEIWTTSDPAGEACGCANGYCWSRYLGYYNTSTTYIPGDWTLQEDEVVVGETNKDCTGSEFLYTNNPCPPGDIGQDYPTESIEDYLFIAKKQG